MALRIWVSTAVLNWFTTNLFAANTFDYNECTSSEIDEEKEARKDYDDYNDNAELYDEDGNWVGCGLAFESWDKKVLDG